MKARLSGAMLVTLRLLKRYSNHYSHLRFLLKVSRVYLTNGMTLAATEFFDEDDDRLEYKLGEQVWVNWTPGWEVILPHEA